MDRYASPKLEWLLSSQNTNFHWGDVWEWTSNTFSEFPDFVPHLIRTIRNHGLTDSIKL